MWYWSWRRLWSLWHNIHWFRNWNFHFWNFRFWKLYLWNQFFFVESISDGVKYKIIYLLLITESKFHLCRVHIYIQIFPINCKMKYRKWIFMLHHKFFVGIFNSFRNYITFYISSIDKVIFIITIPS